MIHGDNKGLVMPPKVAPTQVVIIPVYFKDSDNEKLNQKAIEIAEKLRAKNIRVEYDLRESVKSGRKYNEWEMQGVPIRLELGPKDLLKNEFRLVRRVDGTKK